MYKSRITNFILGETEALGRRANAKIEASATHQQFARL